MQATVVLSVLSSIVYGASDFFAGWAVRRIPVIKATTIVYAASAVVIIATLLLGGWSFSPGAVISGGVSGIFALIGFAAGFAAMAIGPMSLLSPAIALIEAVIPIGVSCITGRALGAVAWCAIGIGLIAIILIAMEPGKRADRVTARAAILAGVSGVGLGLSVVALSFSPRDSGLIPAAAEAVTGLIFLAAILLISGVRDRVRRARSRAQLSMRRAGEPVSQQFLGRPAAHPVSAARPIPATHPLPASRPAPAARPIPASLTPSGSSRAESVDWMHEPLVAEGRPSLDSSARAGVDPLANAGAGPLANSRVDQLADLRRDPGTDPHADPVADADTAPRADDGPIPSLRGAWRLSIAAGVLLGGGNSVFLFALHGGNLAVVAVLASLYPLGTIILASIILRERIIPRQAAGIVLAIVATVLLSTT